MNIAPKLHDAELFSLNHDLDAGSVRCDFRTEEGVDVVLRLTGVSRFRCTDFGMQNVVLDLLGTVWQDIALEDLRSHITWLSSDSDGKQQAKPEEIEQTLSDVLAGQTHCVILIPSWGAQFVGISKKVDWQ